MLESMICSDLVVRGLWSVACTLSKLVTVMKIAIVNYSYLANVHIIYMYTSCTHTCIHTHTNIHIHIHTHTQIEGDRSLGMVIVSGKVLNKDGSSVEGIFIQKILPGSLTDKDGR